MEINKYIIIDDRSTNARKLCDCIMRIEKKSQITWIHPHEESYDYLDDIPDVEYLNVKLVEDIKSLELSYWKDCIIFYDLSLPIIQSGGDAPKSPLTEFLIMHQSRRSNRMLLVFHTEAGLTKNNFLDTWAIENIYMPQNSLSGIIYSDYDDKDIMLDNFLSDAKNEWNIRFNTFKYHSDNIINDAITFYLHPYKANWHGDSGHHCWEHDVLDRGKFPEDSDKYREHVINWINKEDMLVDYLSDHELKSLFMLGVKDEHPNKWIRICDVDSGFCCSRHISGPTLRNLFIKFKINILNIENIDEQETYCLPVVPGFAFLLSLKEFINKINPEKIIFDKYKGTEGDIFGLLILFEREKAEEDRSSRKYGLFDTYKKKDNENEISGASECLYNILKCNCGLDHNVASSDSPILDMLTGKGLIKDCVAIMPVPFGIHLLWTGESSGSI